MKYLLDANICIYFLKVKFNLNAQFQLKGIANCYISEITLAELKFGAENSQNPSKNRLVVSQFENSIVKVPILGALDVYAFEKTRLRKLGTPVDDFDLLIGASAIAYNMVLVTHNTKHFARMSGIQLEDWTEI